MKARLALFESQSIDRDVFVLYESEVATLFLRFAGGSAKEMENGCTAATKKFTRR